MFEFSIVGGRLTRDPQTQVLEDGREVVKTVVAVNGYDPRQKNNANKGRTTKFVNLTFWNGNGKNLMSHPWARKGAVIVLVGKVEEEMYNGRMQYSIPFCNFYQLILPPVDRQQDEVNEVSASETPTEPERISMAAAQMASSDEFELP